MTVTLTVELTAEQCESLLCFEKGMCPYEGGPEMIEHNLEEFPLTGGIYVWLDGAVYLTDLGKQAQEQLKKAAKDAAASRAPKIDEPY